MSRSEFDDAGLRRLSAALAQNEWSVWEDADVDPRLLTAEMGRLLFELDGPELESTEERLVTVARSLGDASRAAVWSLYRIDVDPSGYGAPRLARRQHRRPHPIALPSELDLDVAEVVDGVGLFAARRSGPDQLRARLLRSGLREMLVLGGYGPDADQWVLELGGDDMSFALLSLMPAFYPVVQAALSFPRSARRAVGQTAEPAPRLWLVGEAADDEDGLS